MSSTISKWGNSLGVRLPQHLVRQAGLSLGDSVEFQVDIKGQIRIVPVEAEIDFPALHLQLDSEANPSDWPNDAELGAESVTW